MSGFIPLDRWLIVNESTVIEHCYGKNQENLIFLFFISRFFLYICYKQEESFDSLSRCLSCEVGVMPTSFFQLFTPLQITHFYNQWSIQTWSRNASIIF